MLLFEPVVPWRHVEPVPRALQKVPAGLSDGTGPDADATCRPSADERAAVLSMNRRGVEWAVPVSQSAYRLGCMDQAGFTHAFPAL